jgi:hypothetical protein
VAAVAVDTVAAVAVAGRRGRGRRGRGRGSAPTPRKVPQQPLRSASEAARVQPFKCSQQVKLATRKPLSSPLVSSRLLSSPLGSSRGRRGRGRGGRRGSGRRGRGRGSFPTSRKMQQQPLYSASEAARVQPFRCSQQVKLATRRPPLQPPNRRGSSPSNARSR